MFSSNKVVTSLFWSIIKNWGGRLTSLLVFMILTRLLDAKSIGAVAFVGAVIAILVAISEMGLAEYLIYREDSDEARNQIFWFQIFFVSGVFLLLVLLGPYFLNEIGQHDSAKVIPYLGLVLPISSLISVQDAIQRRALQFKLIAMRSLVGLLVGAIVGVSLAFAGAGMWSLVFKQLAETAVMALFLWLTSDWRPRTNFSWSGFDKIFNYGRFMAGGRLLDVLAANIDDIIVGSVFGQKDLGIYSIGKKIYLISSELLMGVTQQVAGPVFAKANRDKNLLGGMFINAVHYCSWFVVPLYVILFLFSPVIVPLVFGKQWVDSVWILQCFCFVGILFPLQQFNWSLIMASGNAARSFQYSLWRNLGGTAIILFAVSWGVSLFTFSQVARMIFSILIGYFIVKAVINFKFSNLIKSLIPGLVTALLIVVIFYLENALILPRHFLVLCQAVSCCVVLSVSYFYMVRKIRLIRG